MHALYRTRGTLQKIVVLTGEGDHGSMAALLYARRDESHDALVPASVINANATGPALLAYLIDKFKGLVTHRRFDVSALTIDLIQNPRILAGRLGAVSQQALDADRDIFQSSRRIDSRPDCKAKVCADASIERSARLA